MMGETNSGSNVPAQQRGLKKWAKGQSGNPSGRPKNDLGPLIRNRTNHGRSLVEKCVRVWLGEEPEFGPEQRMQALKWLSEYGWFKPRSADQGPEAVRAELLRVFMEVREHLEPETFNALVKAMDNKTNEY
jgi:hypothetical protein